MNRKYEYGIDKTTIEKSINLSCFKEKQKQKQVITPIRILKKARQGNLEFETKNGYECVCKGPGAILSLFRHLSRMRA